MAFDHPTIVNLKSNIPWNIEHSKLLKYNRYADDKGCVDCGEKYPGRYIDGNLCVTCTLKNAAATWATWIQGNPARPDPFPISINAALAMGVTYVYLDRICKNGPHFIQKHIRTGRCATCFPGLIAPTPAPRPQLPADTIISKQDAIACGYTQYRTGNPCNRGHTGPRYTATGNCIECIKGIPAIAPAASMGALRSISVSEQEHLFIGWHHSTPRVMIDAYSRKFTRTQFNLLFESPACYELTHGREPLMWPWDAFIANFGRGKPREI